MSGILEGRVAIVTGAARGIGLATAQTMVMQGARVVVADNGASIDGSPEDSVVVDAAVERCNALAAGHALAVKADVSVPGAAQQLVDAARDAFGAVDIVINNAAILRETPIFDAQRDVFDHTLSNNLTAAFALLAAATPVMRDQVRAGRIPGSIVNLVSAAGLYGQPGQAAYAAAKAGLVGLTRAVAFDVRPLGVTCNAVVPFAATRVTLAMQPASDAQALFKERAMKLPSSYVANLITWLASTQAASVTGQLFGVRGRELMLFSQPRPIKTVFTGPGAVDADAMAGTVLGQLGPEFADLSCEWDAFGSDPVI